MGPQMQIYSAYLLSRSLAEALLKAYVHADVQSQHVGYYQRDAECELNALAARLGFRLVPIEPAQIGEVA